MTKRVELEDQAVAAELIDLDDDIEALELRLLNLKAKRDQLTARLNEQLTAIGVRSTWLERTRVTISREPRWTANPVASGVEWAIRHGHRHILTLKDREFSKQVDQVVLAHGEKILPAWVKRFNLLTLKIQKQ